MPKEKVKAESVTATLYRYKDGNPDSPALMRARSTLHSLLRDLKFELREVNQITEEVYEQAKAVTGSPILRVETRYSDGSHTEEYALEPTVKKIRDMFAPMFN